MHSVVSDEVYRIGYEALRNACVHSRAARIDVALEYGHDLTLLIRDNGVGVDPAVAERGEGKHSAGTAVTLIVPGRIMFL
jgi:signal transduction histidine kinase